MAFHSERYLHEKTAIRVQRLPKRMPWMARADFAALQGPGWTEAGTPKISCNLSENRHRGSGYPLSPATPPGMRVRTGRFRKIEPLRAGGPIHRFATRASPLDRLPFRLHRLLNLKSSAVADWLAQCHS
jgi:hypothetical protein